MLLKRNCRKRFAIPLDFEFLKQSVLPYYLHGKLFATIELNKSDKVILCSDDTAATYKLSALSLEYNAIVNVWNRKKVSVA